MNKKTRSFIFWMLIASMCYHEIETNIIQNWLNWLSLIINASVMALSLIKAYKTIK